MTAPEVHQRAVSLGYRLRAEDGRLLVFGDETPPPDLADALRQHKAELLVYLDDKAALHLRPDEMPWLHVARQILAGEFDGAERATVESLAIGLRGIRHRTCQLALARIDPASHARRQTP